VVDDEDEFEVRDSDESYEESPTISINATQKVTGKKKRKRRKIEGPLFKNFIVMGS
jgi:hypothetical protein